MKVYEKLVRDKIPQIIEASGSKCMIRILEDNEYENALKAKMQEELKEFLEASEENQLEELADLVEVVYSFVRNKGVGNEELERIRKVKYKERGGFDEKIMLMSVE